MAIEVGALEVLLKLKDQMSAELNKVMKSTEGAQKELKKWTDEDQRAAMAMSGVHDEALRMNMAFDQTKNRAGAMADTVGRVSTTLARSADAFGLPVGPLRLLDDVMDVAEIGFKNMSTSAAGFNAASVGVAGAGLAIGAGIGAAIVKFTSLDEVLGNAIAKMYAYITVTRTLEGAEADLRQEVRRAVAVRDANHAALLANMPVLLEVAKAKAKEAEQTKILSDFEKTFGFETKNITAARKAMAEVEANSIEGRKRAAAETERAADAEAASIRKTTDEYQKAVKAHEEWLTELVKSSGAFHEAAKKTQADWASAADANIKMITDKYLRMSALLGPTTGEVTAQFNELMGALSQIGKGIGGLDDTQLMEFIKKMEELGDTSKLTEEQWEKLGDAYTLAMERGLIGVEKTAEATKKHRESIADSLSGISDVLTSVREGFVAMGMDADSSMMKAVSALQIGFEAAENFFDAFAKGDVFGMIGAGIAGIGGIVGVLFGGNKEIMQVNDMRDAFFEAQGGFEAFSKSMAAVSDEDWAKKIFNARTVKEFNELVEQAQGLLGLQTEAQQGVNDAMERYGLTIEEMGPKFQQQRLDEMAGQLLKDYELLKASGADMNAVISKMAPNMNEYVQTALAAGQSIPENMKAIVDQMIEQGLLLDANGEAYKSAEEAGITYTKTLTEGLMEVVDAIKALVAALTGVPQSFTVPSPNYGKPEDSGLPGYAKGTSWTDFGGGTPVMLHGVERVQTPEQASMGDGALLSEMRGMRTDMADMKSTMARALTEAVLMAR